MLRNFLGYAVVSAILAGCSSSPSDGDVKQAVETMLGGCPYFSLEKFKKVNGVAVGEGRHAVDVVFTVKVSPVAGAKELLDKGKSESAAINQRLADAISAKRQAEAKALDVDSRISKAKESRDSALADSLERNQLRGAISQLDTDVFSLKGTAYESSPLRPINGKIRQDCANVHPMIQVYEPDNLDQYTKTFTKAFSGTLTLVKTDNGWRGTF